MNARIQRLTQRLQVGKATLCITKSRLWMQSLNDTEGEPQVVRRAKAFANIVENIPIFIEDDELIVGNVASKIGGLELTFWPGTWPKKELDSLKNEGFMLSDDDEEEVLKQNDFWRTKTLTHRAEQIFDNERLWPFVQSGVILPPWKSKNGESGGGQAESGMGLTLQGLLTIEWGKVLNFGLNSIIEEAKDELKKVKIIDTNSIKKVDYLKSVIISHSAIIRFANRFANLAVEMAANEKNPVRCEELKRISNICSWVPANPARTFYEAIQSFWFIFLILNPSNTASFGRFDQYMYPFYKRDKEAGKLTDEETIELLECLRIKDMQIKTTAGGSQRKNWAGMAKWHNCIIGGQTAEGKDATNELSYLILEAARDCQTPHYTITVRVHEDTPKTLMIKALELVRTGIGIPAFVSDKSYIKYLLKEGIPIKTARDYVLAGCLDATIPGQSRIKVEKMFVVPLVLDIFMHKGIEPRTGKQLGPITKDLESYTTFEEFLQAFKHHLAYFMDLTAEYNNLHLLLWAELFPDAITSSLMHEGIKAGKVSVERTLPFENGAAMNPVGMINVADSLAAIKKLVYEDKKITMKQLLSAMSANWQGDGNEKVRKLLLAAPKFGNDDDYVDSIARDLYKFWADTTIKFVSAYGGKHKPTAISISAQWPGGALTGATPDGRYSGDTLADGTMSPMRGRDLHGPTAVVKSAMKIDQSTYQATLLNMKFHPSALKNEEDLNKLSALIRTYLSNGGKHVQFNVVDKDMLVEAKKHPENHRDLIVRVAGYSAYFVQLGQGVQDEVIGRTEHTLN